MHFSSCHWFSFPNMTWIQTTLHIRFKRNIPLWTGTADTNDRTHKAPITTQAFILSWILISITNCIKCCTCYIKHLNRFRTDNDLELKPLQWVSTDRMMYDPSKLDTFIPMKSKWSIVWYSWRETFDFFCYAY